MKSQFVDNLITKLEGLIFAVKGNEWLFLFKKVKKLYVPAL